jgi:hypothetical protein
VFRPQETVRKTRMGSNNTPLLYGSENLTIKARDARRVKEAEMKCI